LLEGNFLLLALVFLRYPSHDCYSCKRVGHVPHEIRNPYLHELIAVMFAVVCYTVYTLLINAITL